MSTKQTYVSVDAADMKEGTGLFDDVDATIRKFRYTKQAPEGYIADGNPIFASLDLELIGDAPLEERMVNQSYSLGATAGDLFTISPDGCGLISNEVDDAGRPLNQLRKDSKFGTLMTSLKQEGVSASILQSGDLSAAEGVFGRWKRVADKARNFGDDARTKPGQKPKFPPSTLVLVKKKDAPVTGMTATTASPAASATNATAAPVGFDLDTETLAVLKDVLADAAKANRVLQRAHLTMAVSKKASANPNRAILAKRAGEEEFLLAAEAVGEIVYKQTEKGQPVGLAA